MPRPNFYQGVWQKYESTESKLYSQPMDNQNRCSLKKYVT